MIATYFFTLCTLTFSTFYSFGLENHARDIHNIQTRREFKRTYTRASYTPRPQIRKKSERRTKNRSINLVTDSSDASDDDIQVIVSPKKISKKSSSIRRKKASSVSTVRIILLKNYSIRKKLHFFSTQGG